MLPACLNQYCAAVFKNTSVATKSPLHIPQINTFLFLLVTLRPLRQNSIKLNPLVCYPPTPWKLFIIPNCFHGVHGLQGK